MKEYIETLVFGLKNLEKTKGIYRDYKTKEFNQLMKDSKESIKVHFKHLQEDIEDDFYTGERKSFFESLDLFAKIDVRFLKTNINHSCQDMNWKFIESITLKPNKSKIRCFAIRFYLKYYAKINKIMHNTLGNIMEGEADE